VDSVMMANFMRDAFERRLGVVPTIKAIRDSSGTKQIA